MAPFFQSVGTSSPQLLSGQPGCHTSTPAGQLYTLRRRKHLLFSLLKHLDGWRTHLKNLTQVFPFITTSSTLSDQPSGPLCILTSKVNELRHSYDMFYRSLPQLPPAGHTSWLSLIPLSSSSNRRLIWPAPVSHVAETRGRSRVRAVSFMMIRLRSVICKRN